MSDELSSSFQDYTRSGELEFLISEFNKLEPALNTTELSFVFREQTFHILLIRRYTNNDYTSSLGHFGFPEGVLTHLFWRAFNPPCEEMLLILPKDETLNISSETAKIIFSAYHCSSLIRFTLVIKRTYSFEFLSMNPSTIVMKIFGDWKFSDSVNWAQAKLILNSPATNDSISLIQSCIKSQYRSPFLFPPFSTFTSKSVTLPIGRYYGSPKVKLLVYFLNPSVKNGLFERELAPIILSKLEIENFPDSVLHVGLEYLNIFSKAPNPEISARVSVNIDRKTKVFQFSNLASLPISPELIQYVLFRKTPISFSERLYTSFLGAFFGEPNITNDLTKCRYALGTMCKLYLEVIQAIEKLASSENLNICGIVTKPQWSDPLVIQHISSIEFMIDCIKRDMIKSPQNRSNLKLLNSDDLIVIPEVLEDGTEGLTSDRAEVYSDSSRELFEDNRALKRLVSDMQAFKAANPDSTLADFIRWHSPRDWNESDKCLSGRMSSKDNDWTNIWEGVEPLEARRQRPLFNPREEIANSIHYLEDIEVGQLLEQFLPQFNKLIEKMVVEAIPDKIDASLDKEQVVSLVEVLKDMNFSKESIIDLINGKSVLLSQEREREFALKNVKDFLSGEVFISTKNGSKFYTMNTNDGTTTIGQMIKE